MRNTATPGSVTTDEPGTPAAQVYTPRHEAKRVKFALWALAWLLITQALDLASFGNGLSPTADPYGEADIVRSAQHYSDYGFLADSGLPHITYGSRFPNQGWLTDLKQFPLPYGVYTHYPPLPNLIGGILEITIGFRHLWLWRMVPIGCGLLALIYAHSKLREALGSQVAGVMLALVAIAPMTASHMHALHYEGYAQALLVSELALITGLLFAGKAVRPRSIAVTCAMAFLQGCLSFDYAFIVLGAAIPLSLLARAYGRHIAARTVVLLVGGSAFSFGIAHLLHFWQVAHFYGSFGAALQDFSSRAYYRFNGGGGTPYIATVLRTLIIYARILWFSPDNPHFGPLLGLLSGAALMWRTRWLERVGPAIAASYGIAALWLLVMPSHSIMHAHIIPRLFFLAYYVVCLALALRLIGRLPESAAD